MDPELLKALAGAGMTEEQLRMLGPQLQMGQQMMQPQMAQGSHVGAGPFQTYVAASPIEHLANAARQIIGAKIARGAMDKQQDLLAQQQKARQGAFQSLQTAMSGGQGGTLGEAGGGMARPPDPQAAQALMMAMAGSGDSALQAGAHFGLQEQNLARQQSVLENTLRHQQVLEGQSQGRLDLGAQRVDQAERTQKTQFDPLGNMVTTPTHAPKPGSALPLSTGGGAKKTPWSPEALDKDATQLAVSGDYKRMPGKIGAAYDLAVRSRSTELYPDAERALNKADYVSNMGSLRKLTLAQDSLESFEKGAIQNGKLMLDSAKGIVDVGSPLFNKPIRYIAQQLGGSPAAAQFNAARQVFVQEAGKVLGGAVQGGGITEGQRHEVQELMAGNLTIPQMEATLQTLQADMANRKAGAAQQIEAIRGRMSGKPAAAASAATTQAPPPQKATHRFNAATGKIEAIP